MINNTITITRENFQSQLNTITKARKEAIKIFKELTNIEFNNIVKKETKKFLKGEMVIYNISKREYQLNPTYKEFNREQANKVEATIELILELEEHIEGVVYGIKHGVSHKPWRMKLVNVSLTIEQARLINEDNKRRRRNRIGKTKDILSYGLELMDLVDNSTSHFAYERLIHTLSQRHFMNARLYEEQINLIIAYKARKYREQIIKDLSKQAQEKRNYFLRRELMKEEN